MLPCLAPFANLACRCDSIDTIHLSVCDAQPYASTNCRTLLSSASARPYTVFGGHKAPRRAREAQGWETRCGGGRGHRERGKPVSAVEEERVAVGNKVADPLGEGAIELKVHGQPHAMARREEDGPAAGVRHDREHVRCEHGPVVDGQRLGAASRRDSVAAGLPLGHLGRVVDGSPQLGLLQQPDASECSPLLLMAPWAACLGAARSGRCSHGTVVRKIRCDKISNIDEGEVGP